MPVARIEAKHNCSTARKGTIDNAEGLEKVLYLARGCQVMLRTNLWHQHKLCNGTVGKVVDILYENSYDFPAVILCEFEDYDGPTIIPGKKIVPIKPILRSWNDSSATNCTRLQFPITVCYACSIHKSQGMTLDKVTVILHS